MKNLRDMSINEVLKVLGRYVDRTDIDKFIKDDDKCDELKTIMNNCKTYDDQFLELSRFLKENEKYIDLEKFVLLKAYRIKEKINMRLPTEDLKSKFSEAMKMLEGCKANAYIIDEKIKLHIINFDTLSDKKTSNKNQKRLQEINEQVQLYLIVAAVPLSDLEDIVCVNKEVGDYLSQYISFRILNKGMDRHELGYEELEEYVKTEEYLKNYIIEFSNVLLEYAEYINIDKLLLMSIYRQLETLETRQLDFNTIIRAHELLKQEYKFINEKIRLKGTIQTIEDGDKEISITAKELKEKIDNNFVNGQYIGDKTIAKIRSQIFDENTPLEMYDPRVIHLLKINMNELMSIVKDDDNFKYLLKFKMINDETLTYILMNKDSISTDIIKYLLSTENIDNEDILKLYLQGIVTLENIRELNQNKELNIAEIVSEEEMIRLYKELNKNGQSEQFTKYLPLFKELKIKDTDIENKKEVGQNLIEQLDGDFEQEDLKKMYEFGMIPVETAIEWGGESITQDMFNEGILKPIDAKRLYRDNILNIEIIKRVLITSNLSDEDKLTLICSTFDSEEDIDIRMELIQYLSVDDKGNKRNSDKQKSKTNFNGLKNNTSRNAYVTDPCLRWRLISLLDSEYSQEVCKDGYIIFRLPNVKNGTVVIEKMFKKTQDGIVASYGNATYILSEEEFTKNENDIIDINSEKQKTINLSTLLELREQEKTDRLNHSSKWGNNIKDYFNVEKEQSIYDNKKIEEIDKAIQGIENSRTLK